MPQMMPMIWSMMIIFNFILLIIFITNMNFYFIPMPYFTFKASQLSLNWLWKW